MFSKGHILTIIIGLAKVAIIIVIFNVAQSNFETIVYALLIFIYSEVQKNWCHSRIEINSSSYELYEKFRLLRGMQTEVNESDSIQQAVHAMITYIFVIIMRLICLFYFIKTIFEIR